MEISRKTYMAIIEILTKEDIDGNKAIKLSNTICELIENSEQVQERVVFNKDSGTGYVPPISCTNPSSQVQIINGDSDNQINTQEPKKFKPGDKVRGGYINSKGKFVATTRPVGGVTNEDGSINKDLTFH